MNPNITIRPFDWQDLNPLAQCYARGRIWADEPWNEWLKCPKCPADQNNFGVTFTDRICPRCGSKLTSFWKIQDVENDIKIQLGKAFAKGYLALKESQIVGFTWGYPLTLNCQVVIPDLHLEIPSGSSLINKEFPIPYYAGDVGYIDEVGVRPAFRRQGIARALTLEILSYFSYRCNNTVFLRTDERATEAVKLYESLGFQRDYKLTDPIFKHRGYWTTDVTGLYYSREVLQNHSATPASLKAKNQQKPLSSSFGFGHDGGGWEH